MNTEYTRKQLKQAMDLIGNIDLNNYSNTTWKQRRLNEAFSILFDFSIVASGVFVLSFIKFGLLKFSVFTSFCFFTISFLYVSEFCFIALSAFLLISFAFILAAGELAVDE